MRCDHNSLDIRKQLFLSGAFPVVYIVELKPQIYSPKLRRGEERGSQAQSLGRLKTSIECLGL